MDQPITAPYGAWKSPISADLIVAGSIRLGHVAVDGRTVYWAEQRPSEGGRSVVMKASVNGGEPEEVTPTGYSVRTRVHEYGGGDFSVADGVLWFVNFGDQRLYALAPGMAPRPLTPEGSWRYADFVHDGARDRLIAVREEHGQDREPVNTLVSVALTADVDAGRVLMSGADFYAAPRLSPDGGRLAWIEWNHPNMPWDGTMLKVATVMPDGGLGTPVTVAGGPDISAVQPKWLPDGTLVFADDHSGWWNLYRWDGTTSRPILTMEAEFALPPWQFGQATFDHLDRDLLVAAYILDGVSYLTRLDMARGIVEPLNVPFNDIDTVLAIDGRVVLVAGSPTEAKSLEVLDPATGDHRTIRPTSRIPVDRASISTAQAIEFPSANGRTAYGFYYPPRNHNFVAPRGTLPPLLVKSHGGPTAATDGTLKLAIQYWTSRGFAVLDVNYGGSTGYGTAYRRRLNGNWGIVDVEDCVAGAAYLVAAGLVDGDRLAISGGSAGGYTTLAALTFHDVFKAGASYYGISDLAALAADTHKFESRYPDSLIGPPDRAAEIFRERSPIHHVDRLSCPMIFFQGLEDKVVPPDQTEKMVEALRRKGVPVAYLPFPGEMHGFRTAANIKRAMEAEFAFYGLIFGFTPADPIEPPPVDNLRPG